jgi:hypothetical protein
MCSFLPLARALYKPLFGGEKTQTRAEVHSLPDEGDWCELNNYEV